MNIIKNETGLSVQTVYCPDHIVRFRAMGGRWSDPQWVFPITSEKMLTEYVDEQWGLGEPDTDVMVETTRESDGMAYFHGYVLASRRFRDYAPRLVESTGCDQPFSSSGGSMKHPRVNVARNAKFALRVPRVFALRHGLITGARLEAV